MSLVKIEFCNSLIWFEQSGKKLDYNGQEVDDTCNDDDDNGAGDDK